MLHTEINELNTANPNIREMQRELSGLKAFIASLVSQGKIKSNELSLFSAGLTNAKDIHLEIPRLELGLTETKVTTPTQKENTFQTRETDSNFFAAEVLSSSPPKETKETDEIDYKEMVGVFERQIFNHSEEIEKLMEENRKLKESKPIPIENRDKLETIRKLKRDKAFLEVIINKIKTVSNKFFAFAIEEDQFKKDFTRIMEGLKIRGTKQLPQLYDMFQNQVFSGRRREVIPLPRGVVTPISLKGVPGEINNIAENTKTTKSDILTRLKNTEKDLMKNKRLQEWFRNRVNSKSFNTKL